MNLVIKGRNMVVSDALSAYVGEKIGRIGRYLWDGARCELELSTEKNPSISDNQVAEATIFTKGPVIRAREASPDMYTSVDLVADKLERQVKKYRGKLVARTQGAHREAVLSQGFAVPEEAEREAEEAGEMPKIVKVKQFIVKPMTPEEAALQLEMVGHDFFVFVNSETQDTNVVYRRRDAHYGLIEPQR
ncbi:MAG: ribosome-associated translation inhibitor RaiA [Actinobacteria bacterium]|nr:ribosome-associated translation inhibitor RaiA [Actinomycetota bacterium]OPZ79955.1 MAG: Light-repressed protein A [Actinobacteria bacterium ADurb.Bin444]